MAPSEIGRREFIQAGAGGLGAMLAGCSTGEEMGLFALSIADGSERWVNRIGDVAARPIVVDDAVYVGSARTVYALDAANGDQRWSYDVEFEFTYDIRQPTPMEDLILVPAGRALYGLDPANGGERWTFTAKSDLWSAPPIVDETVLLGTDDGRLHGVSVADGSERWTYDGDGLREEAVSVADGSVYVGSKDGRVTAIGTTDGSVRWSVDTRGPLRDGPAVQGDTVYVSTTDGRVYALSAENGRERWRWRVPEDVLSAIVGDDGPTFQVLGQSVHVEASGQLFSLGIVEGSEQWHREIDFVSYYVRPAGAFVFVGGNYSTSMVVGETSETYAVVEAIHRRAGTERWSSTLGQVTVETPPVVEGDAVCAGTQDGVVHCVGAEDGSGRWSVETGAERMFAPVMTGGTAFVGTES